MGKRPKSEDRCQRCHMRQVLCICDLIPVIQLDTRLILLAHYRELKRTTNTGRIATLALPNSEIRVRGLPSQPIAAEGIKSTGTTLLLYPTDDSQTLTPEYVASLPRPITLLVPDGNWRQAAKTADREPALQGYPRIKLMPGRPTQYRLRKESKPGGLATFEAIARAMGVIEGPEVQERMEYLFRIMVERTLWSRGELKAEDCFGGVPAAALTPKRER